MKQGDERFSITNMTRGKLPSLPFLAIKNAVLGKKYRLSLVFATNAVSKKLNRSYRGKNKPTNILSFSVNSTEGEIFINPSRVKADLAKFDRTYRSMLGFLFIHGLLHLKGFEHSAIMERTERKFCKRFGL